MGNQKNDKFLYIMLLPVVIYFLLFHLYPIYLMKLAFTSQNIVKGDSFIGLKYFKHIFNNAYFFSVLKNTVLISLFKNVLFFPIAIGFALMINEIKNNKIRALILAIISIPHFISWVTISGIYLNLFSQDGLVNTMFNIDIKFLTDGYILRVLIVLGEVWKNVGWDSLIFYVSMKSLDKSLFEAASIDGASRWQKTKHITLPGMKEIIITMLIINFAFLLNPGFDQIINLINGANVNQVDILDTFSYRIGLLGGDTGFASAIGLIKSILGFFLVFTSHKLSKEINGEGLW